MNGIIPKAGGRSLVGHLGGAVVHKFKRKGKVNVMRVRRNVCQELRQSTLLREIVFHFHVIALRIVKSDSVDAKLVHPVETHVSNELLRAAVVIIKVLESAELFSKNPDVGRGFGITVQPPVRESVAV